jgi:hypothetical protein
MIDLNQLFNNYKMEEEMIFDQNSETDSRNEDIDIELSL